MTRFVLDSYAVLSIIRRESPAAHVLQLLMDPGHQHWMSAINLGEVYYQTAREESVDDALNAIAWLRRMPVQLEGIDVGMAVAAVGLKAGFALSYADCFAAALAQQLQAKIVTGDPEFEQLERAGIVEIEWLPPKPKSRQTR